MTPFFEEVLVFLVMSVLVGLFAWIYLRARGATARLWLFGWTAILVHFAVPVLQHAVRWPRPLLLWLQVATLVVAGTFFLLSVSEVFSVRQKRLAFLCFITGGSLLYLTGTVLEVHQGWFFAGLLLAGNVYGMFEAFRSYGLKNPYFYALFLLLPYGGWVLSRALRADLERGLEFYLFGFFFVTALIYFRRFRRITPGVLLTSSSFLAWGFVFPVAGFLQARQVGPAPESFFWDLPKYFVAFGMLLTLLENETAAAGAAASQFRALFESNLAAVYVSTFDGKLLDCNTAYLKMYGFGSKQEALGDTFVSACADPQERAAFIQALDRDGQVVNYECRQLRKDGTPFWLLERATVVKDPFGRRVIEGTSIDITERKQAELALKQSEERFATLFRQSPIACVLASLEGVFLNVNENFLRMVGRTADDVVGKSSVELGFFSSYEERQKFYERLREQGFIQNLEVSFKDATGGLRQGIYFANFVWIGGKECIFGMMLDQTEHRELERKFLQAQKMDALGRLAGGVAHDFNNLLGVIGAYAELLEARLVHVEDYRRYCAKILETTERASGLTRQLLTFSRKEIVRPMPLRPDKTIRALEILLSPLLGEDIEVLLDLASTGTVVMDRTHFEQIILNIVVNSRDAMPSGGQIHIKTADVSSPILTGSGQVANWVAILITDTGSGMDEQTRLHAFEPFYTTKGVGRGTGLGLATVYGIVQQGKGEIKIESQPGHGTTISILLPASAQAEAIAPSPALDMVRTGKGSILLVEDEEELRNTSAEFLVSIGYSVTSAASGLEGLQIAAAPGTIDLVVTDVVMPKMNGREFSDELLKLRPCTKVLFVSGYADDVVLQAGISLHDVPFLPKPYSLKQLSGAINQLLCASELKTT